MIENTEVKYPKYGEVFPVNDTVYNNIVKQVRDEQFNDSAATRLQTTQQQKQSDLKLKEADLKQVFQQQLADENLPYEAVMIVLNRIKPTN